ncbi:hypothetical protein [Heterosigma akashiwo virus 01]|uniref:Uncharacterized protein n=1 Tax=Heterosigma akashiwo virus 01 TaxID=97195 RepID=A0A1C9C593_HAV01|nr:hypothetical protein D1R72_gp131 [Heterosigma akashiwo virus 01]AOM63462.1 hypothetical protein [Heterosigma akashiwo virus 01]
MNAEELIKEEILKKNKAQLIDFIIRNWDFNTIQNCITKLKHISEIHERPIQTDLSEQVGESYIRPRTSSSRKSRSKSKSRSRSKSRSSKRSSKKSSRDETIVDTMYDVRVYDEFEEEEKEGKSDLSNCVPIFFKEGTKKIPVMIIVFNTSTDDFELVHVSEGDCWFPSQKMLVNEDYKKKLEKVYKKIINIMKNKRGGIEEYQQKLINFVNNHPDIKKSYVTKFKQYLQSSQLSFFQKTKKLWFK